MRFTKKDLKFLRACGISAEPPADMTTEQVAAQLLQDVQAMSPEEKAEFRKQVRAQRQLNGTEKTLQELGLPLTRENYLRLEFLGNPPAELDGELESELPEKYQKED